MSRVSMASTQNKRLEFVLNTEDNNSVKSDRLSSGKVKKKFTNLTADFQRNVQQFQQVYHFGIIDFLQDWSANKKMERCLKTCVKLGKKDISAVPPNIYQKRFYSQISKYVLKPAIEHFENDESYE